MSASSPRVILELALHSVKPDAAEAGTFAAGLCNLPVIEAWETSNFREAEEFSSVEPDLAERNCASCRGPRVLAGRCEGVTGAHYRAR